LAKENTPQSDGFWLPKRKGGITAMIRHIRETVARRRGVELESGFTLIELLIVIVVLGILAATVIFALTGVTGQSATAACQSDAKTYEVAVAAYENSPENASNTAPTTTAQLLSGVGTSGAFLHQAANNSGYVVALAGDWTGNPLTVASDVNNAGNVTLPVTMPAGSTVLVGPAGGTLVSYDNELSTNGCNSSNI
jgi:prepilin-type N-terminal cleavage/methylation domain-containing protein